MNRRAALAALAFLAAAWLLGLGTLLPSSNRWFLVLLAPALVYRRGLALPARLRAVRARGAGLRVGAHVRPPHQPGPVLPAADRRRRGHRPRPRAQRAAAGLALRRHAGAVRGRAREGALVARRGAARRALPALARLAPRVPCARPPRRSAARSRPRSGSSIYPAAPPWLAACHGLIGPLERIREHGRPVPARARGPLARDAPLRRQPGRRRAVAARRLVDARRADDLALAAAACGRSAWPTRSCSSSPSSTSASTTSST